MFNAGEVLSIACSSPSGYRSFVILDICKLEVCQELNESGEAYSPRRKVQWHFTAKWAKDDGRSYGCRGESKQLPDVDDAHTDRQRGPSCL
jgi:hypothetical protein